LSANTAAEVRLKVAERQSTCKAKAEAAIRALSHQRWWKLRTRR
jgi:hypothetical protein